MRRKSRGFTLLEILLVVAIIAILAGSASYLVIKQFKGGQEKIAKTQVSSKGAIGQAVQSFYVDCNRYPTTEEGLKVLNEKPEGEGLEGWAGPYLDTADPKDPWGTSFQYVYPGEKNKDGYDLSSAGPDKQHGTEDDIGNWVATEATGG